MRTLNKNRQKLKYANIIGETPIYREVKNEDGTIRKLDTGETEPLYAEPVEFLASISMSGGEAEAQEFGLSLADYNAVVVYPLRAFPIKEGTLIWHKSDVGYKYSDKTVPKPKTADYEVIKVSDSLNVTKLVLKAIVK